MDSKLYPQGRGGVKSRETGNKVEYLDVNGVVIATLDADKGMANVLNLVRATFNPSGNIGDRPTGAHTLGVTIPNAAIIVGGFVDVLTTFTSAADSATIAISVEGANDIVSALAISGVGDIWDAGKHAIIPKANTPESTGVKTTTSRLVTATVGVQALTAGKLHVFLYYVQSE